MPINKDLNEKELENVYGGIVKTDNLPDKFKNIEKKLNYLKMNFKMYMVALLK